eukprot:s766_g6.t1
MVDVAMAQEKQNSAKERSRSPRRGGINLTQNPAEQEPQQAQAAEFTEEQCKTKVLSLVEGSDLLDDMAKAALKAVPPLQGLEVFHELVAEEKPDIRNPSAWVIQKCQEIARQNGTEAAFLKATATSEAVRDSGAAPKAAAKRPLETQPASEAEVTVEVPVEWRSMPLDQWLRSVDNGKGFLLKYQEALCKNFDDLEQVMDLYVRTDSEGNVQLDQTFFDDLQIEKVGHMRLFQKWVGTRRADRRGSRGAQGKGATMNIFRLAGDMLHLTSIMLLLWKLHKSKSCVGVSCRIQEMYALVFIFRYLDLLWSYISVYNTVMKVVFITATIYLIYLMRVKPPISQTYERSTDKFQYEIYLLGPCFLLGILCTEEYSIAEVLWTTSIWLESVAIVPQLVLLQQMREVENLTSQFVATMGAYRALYILNWIYRYFADDYVNWVGWVGGLVQTASQLQSMVCCMPTSSTTMPEANGMVASWCFLWQHELETLEV